MARAPTSFSARQRAQQERNVSPQRRTEQQLEEERKKRTARSRERAAAASPEEKRAAMARAGQNQRGYNLNASRARAAAQGLLLASADEVEAGLRAGGRGLMEGRLPSLSEYYDIKDEINEGLDRYRADMPGEAIALEGAGAVLPAFIPGTQGAIGSRLAALAAQYPGRAAAARLGAEATAYGVGKANRPADIPRSVLEEGLLAAGVYGGIRAGGAGLRKGSELLGRTSAADNATSEAGQIENIIAYPALAPEGSAPSLLGGRPMYSPEQARYALRNMSAAELDDALSSGMFRLPASGETQHGVGKKWWSPADDEGVFGRNWNKGGEQGARVRVPMSSFEARSPIGTREAERWDAASGRWVPLAADDAAPAITFNSEEVGPFLNVQRADLEPETIPEALDAKSIDDLRAILADPAKNIPARVANDYTMSTMGRGYDPNFPDPGTSLQKQSGIARVFREAVEGTPEYKSALFERYGEVMPEVVERAGAQNYDQLTEAAYRQLAKETDDQFDRLPVQLRYHYGEGEYPVPSAMLRDILGEGRLNVFRGGDRHPYLSDVDPATGLTSNEKFRAVHDYFGHGTKGATFRPGGEETAYASHGQMMSPLAQMALLAETRGQNSFVNYSPLNADVIARQQPINKEIRETEAMYKRMGFPLDPSKLAPLRKQLREIGGDIQFAPQTPVLLPPEYLAANTAGGVPEYLRGVIRPAAPTGPERAVHLSHTEGLSRTDPAYYGTGHRGDDYRIRGQKGSPSQHTGFYLGAEGTVVPEQTVEKVSPFAYEAELSNLYDIEADPEQLVKLAKAYSVGDPRGTYAPDFTRMVREYGYSGYRNKFGPSWREGYAANVFDPVELRRRIARGPEGYAEGGYVSYSP